MNWYTQADREELNRNRAQQNATGQVPFQMKRVRIQDSSPSELTVIGQMYVAPFVLASPQSKIQLPIGNSIAYELVKEHLVPPFLEYQEVRIQDEVKHIVLGNLRPETHSLFEEMRAQQKLSPIITDIYREKVEDLQAFYQYRETVLYKVEKEFVTPTTSADTDQLWNFIRNVSLTAEGEVSFAPIGMRFDDELLHSIFLRSMRDICDEIYLYVDLTTQEVKSIIGTSINT